MFRASLARTGHRRAGMLIFLAGLAFLIMLLVIGNHVATHMWHAGDRFLDYCADCDVRYPRPAGIQRLICPHGHVMMAVVAEQRPTRPLSVGLLAVCAGQPPPNCINPQVLG